LIDSVHLSSINHCRLVAVCEARFQSRGSRIVVLSNHYFASRRCQSSINNRYAPHGIDLVKARAACQSLAICTSREEAEQATSAGCRCWGICRYVSSLSRRRITQAKLTPSIEAILEQEDGPVTLRLSGQLMLGVTRIYSRKAHYLFEDCKETRENITRVSACQNRDVV
jgi:hypothetical protein